MAAGTNMAEGAYLANEAAGVIVGKVGATTASNHELRAALDDKWASNPHLRGGRPPLRPAVKA